MFVHLKQGETYKIPYSIGVQQGDNMAPILFNFLMQAFAETMNQKWSEQWDIKKLQLNYMNKGTNSKGRLNNQKSIAKGTPFNLFYLLYIDDGAFLFESREDLQKGTEMLHEHFDLFGLKLHIGEDNLISKSEAMYISPNLTEDETNSLNVDYESDIPVKNGKIRMTKKFKYLGAYISNDLKDDYEIDTRITKATQQIGALKYFFRAAQVEIETKFRIYMAIPLNTVLWGCES